MYFVLKFLQDGNFLVNIEIQCSNVILHFDFYLQVENNFKSHIYFE